MEIKTDLKSYFKKQYNYFNEKIATQYQNWSAKPNKKMLRVRFNNMPNFSIESDIFYIWNIFHETKIKIMG